MEINFNQENTKLNVVVDDWKDAIMQSVNILERNGRVNSNYKDAIIDDYYKYGSYIMISPGIVIPHTRPENGALSVGFSLMTIKNDVYFPDNKEDPIKILIAFSSTDNTEHIKILQIIMSIIEKNIVDNIEELKKYDNEEQMEFLNSIVNKV